MFSRGGSASATDPVCEMKVDVRKSPGGHDHDGETYYFCVPGCKIAFRKQPEVYLSGEKKISM